MFNLYDKPIEIILQIKMKEFNEENVDESPINNLKAELLPQFIQKHRLFQCPKPNCNQQFLWDVDSLKLHISIIHKNYKFYL